MFKQIKYIWQKYKYGISDEDIWDFNDYLARIIPIALKKLKEGSSCPDEFYDKDNLNNECQKWHDTLEEIIQGFQAIQDLNEHIYWKRIKQEDGSWKIEIDEKAQSNLYDKAHKGLTLLCDNYFSLWD